METKQDKPANPALPPPSEMVDDTGLFEVYQRPGLKEHPRTGRGLRSDPPRGPTAGEILARMPEPKAEVVTPKRFAVYEPTTPKPSPAATPEEQAEAEAAHDAAHLDAAADVAATTAASANAHMSHSVENGPIKTVIQHGRHEDRVIESPPPSPSPLPPSATAPVSQPHFSDAPRPAPAAPRGAAGKTCRIALVQSTFNLAITDAMVGNAHKEAERLGCPIVAHLRVPGAFDTPLAAQRLLQRGDVDAVVVIGCIIQGETGHDELIAHATARTLHELALRTDKPVGLAVTGPRMTEAQAWARLDAAAFAVGSVLEQHVLRA
jgi:6,7-dimethyl-8-ribityllumazine synthase